MLTIGGIVLGVDNMQRAVAFWSAALGYQPKADEADEEWTVLQPASGVGTPIALDVSETPVQEVPRMHLDLFARDETEQTAEVARLVSLGATEVDWDLYPEEPDFVVLADPEGNRFCVVDASRI
jgi:catechol 2,3-dioxygenase-like lactoylglutathione lyase family enzyme